MFIIMKTLHICQLTSLHFQESKKRDFLGHFDETLGADFFLFSQTAFLEIYTSNFQSSDRKFVFYGRH